MERQKKNVATRYFRRPETKTHMNMIVVHVSLGGMVRNKCVDITNCSQFVVSVDVEPIFFSLSADSQKPNSVENSV